MGADSTATIMIGLPRARQPLTCKPPIAPIRCNDSLARPIVEPEQLKKTNLVLCASLPFDRPLVKARGAQPDESIVISLADSGELGAWCSDSPHAGPAHVARGEIGS